MKKAILSPVLLCIFVPQVPSCWLLPNWKWTCKIKRKVFARLNINQGRTWTTEVCVVGCTVVIFDATWRCNKVLVLAQGPRNLLVEACLVVHGCWWCPQWVHFLGQRWVTIDIEEWQEELELEWLQLSYHNCQFLFNVHIEIHAERYFTF